MDEMEVKEHANMLLSDDDVVNNIVRLLEECEQILGESCSRSDAIKVINMAFEIVGL